MKEQMVIKNYPWGIVTVSNIIPLITYVLGGFIMFRIGYLWMFLYIGYILFIEFRLLANGCPDCYYYGKWCAFGRGKLSSLFFKKGDPERFACRQVTWKEMAPDFLVTLIPMISGIVLLILHFYLSILLAVIGLVLLASAGNAFVRGQLACKSCKQGEIGCPALDLFSKGKDTTQK